MSRARPYTDADGTQVWFDVRSPATVKHLELLSDVERIDLDDILEENLSQKQVLFRLHKADNLIPEDVLERRRARREKAREQPVCRVCSLEGWECEGRITRHHFVPKWLMRELVNYNAYAARSRCTVPICVGRHRDLHFRGDVVDPASKSIVKYLTRDERFFAEKMLRELKDQHPAIYELIEGGDSAAYEGQLIQDYSKGLFRKLAPAEQAADAVSFSSQVAQAGA